MNKDKTYIKIYNKTVSISEVISIMPQATDILHDLAKAIVRSELSGEILIEIWKAGKKEPNTHNLLKICGTSGKELDKIIKSVKKKKTTSSESVVTESKPILTGIDYKTNRNPREMGAIDEIPSIDFDMPTLPELPKL